MTPPPTGPGCASAASSSASPAAASTPATALGRHRWKIERSIAWLTGYRRLTIRYERHAHLFAAFLSLAAAITSFKKLTT
jgi:transposase